MKKTILIVDDNEDTRLVLSALLNHDGYRVVLAVDGVDGVDLARRERPDLVLMDVRMPGMDGLSAAAALQADSSTRDIPIVGMTADTLMDDDAERAGLLFHSRMQKPLSSALIEAHVRSIIGNP